MNDALGYFLTAASALVLVACMTTVFGVLWIVTGPNDVLDYDDREPDADWDHNPLGNQRGKPY